MKLSIALLALLAFTTALVAEATAPAGLLVNGVHNPLAIDRDAVRFTWRMENSARGAMQTAWQIRVASSPQLLEQGQPDFWDSGRVDSEKSASVEYAGKKLPPATRLWWDVRVWDQNGNASPRSAPARLDTGLAQNDWTGRHIWDGTENPNNFAYFRKTFSVANKPALAKVFVTAHNDYKLYLNGELLGRGPARSNPYSYGQYNSYDITALLKNGVNVFAAMGHWFGRWRDTNIDASNSGINARPAFLLEARIDHPDGTTTTIATDASWKTLATTAFTETNFQTFRNRAAIKYDARREPAGWMTAGFDDSNWQPATVVDRADFRLFAQMAPLQREQAELAPVSVTRANGAWIVAFERCITGWPKLTMRANRPGDIIRVEYYQRTGGKNPAGWDQYTCRGATDAPETWHADFGRHTSFQELKITGYAGDLSPDDIRGIRAHTDADVAGRFHCSSQLLNDIYEMCELSARQNVQQAIISVSANREQAPWLADSWNIGNVLHYNHRNTTVLDKIIRDYAAQQLDDGFIPACSPGFSDWPKEKQIPEWAMSWPMVLWEQYLFSGDETLLREMAPRMERLLAWLKQHQDPGNKLLNPPGWRISDWAGPDLMPAGGCNIATACLYYENLRIASRIFAILERGTQPNPQAPSPETQVPSPPSPVPADASRSAGYAQQAEEIKNAINAHLLKGDRYLCRTDTKDTDAFYALASAWPLRFGIEPPGTRQKILAAIERAGKPAIGGHGGDALYSGLFQAGGGEFAVRDMERYRPMLETNKACWESFDLAPAYQVNHAWTSYPGYLFQKYILGIQPTSGGFATFDIRPETSGLTFAEGAVPTIKGDIVTRWEKNADGSFKLALRVPPNTRASVYIPKFSKETTITESGVLLWERGHSVVSAKPAESGLAGIINVTGEGTFIKCEVESGEYHFSQQLQSQ